MRRWEKALMLQILDTLWVRHLTALDALRQGIGLRAYGQQDPLVAFQKDAFEMYNELRADIQEEVVRKIYHPPVVIKETMRPRNVQALHPDAAASSQASAETPGATRQAPAPVRVAKMPGRNDPCYCGSGKKYKHCHMKTDMNSGNGSGTEPASSAEGKNRQAGRKQVKARRR